ncbi:unnamed protein product [Schistocephalus solidus]|uniref:Cleavage stimulation factor 50 kDa subunit n=1 Tax=Schistocephalus solidus TaxID=70667 RepID=A0A183SDL2_SCHSO|nr:unnamed protein product [Schistocephalus solidus]
MVAAGRAEFQANIRIKPFVGFYSMSFKERDLLYRLIIRYLVFSFIHLLSQLFYDGYQTLAMNLMNLVSPSNACGPSNRLLKLVKTGLSVSDDEQDRPAFLEGDSIAPGTGIDLEIESESSTMAPEAALYETCYVTAHKAACRAAAFNSTGQLVATGSHDSSIKILDVERMLAKSVTGADHANQETPQQQMETHPVIRTLYDHTAEVTCVDFHPDPSLQILVSGSKDYTIKFFDFSNPSVKKAQRSIPEASPIKTLHFHPSGNYLLVGTQHKTRKFCSLPVYCNFRRGYDYFFCPLKGPCVRSGHGKHYLTCAPINAEHVGCMVAGSRRTSHLRAIPNPLFSTVS